ncbi:MAG: hypothetical protein KC505_08860, partial [Myxococcales bacterium]|nr:hypothetical protein [Myxococcales bacterium]
KPKAIQAHDYAELADTQWKGRLVRDGADKGIDFTLNISNSLDVKFDEIINKFVITLSDTYTGKLDAATPSTLVLTKKKDANVRKECSVIKCDNNDVLLLKVNDSEYYKFTK